MYPTMPEVGVQLQKIFSLTEKNRCATFDCMYALPMHTLLFIQIGCWKTDLVFRVNIWSIQLTHHWYTRHNSIHSTSSSSSSSSSINNGLHMSLQRFGADELSREIANNTPLNIQTWTMLVNTGWSSTCMEGWSTSNVDFAIACIAG
jgi:hypothetical protein